MNISYPPIRAGLQLKNQLNLALRKRLNFLMNAIWQPAICADTKAWVRSQPPAVACLLRENILTPQTVRTAIPKTIEPEIHPRFLEILSRKSPYTSPEKYLARIANVKLMGQSGITILPDGAYVLEPLMTKPRMATVPEYYSFARRQLAKVKKSRKLGAYYSTLQLYCNGNNPYHWLHDVLQNLYRVVDLLPKSVTFIVPHGLREWQYESLAAVGVGRERTLSLPPDEIWELETLYFSPPTKLHGRDLPGLNEWVRQACYQKFGIAAENLERNRLIYISRELARGRKIANAAAVERVLADYGFEKYLLEKMTFEQIVKCFASAKAVFAPHGAGLANLIFAQRGTKVLELFEPAAEGIGICYWSMNAMMGHEHWYLLGETVPNSQVPGQPNIELSPEKLDRALEQMLHGSDGPG